MPNLIYTYGYANSKRPTVLQDFALAHNAVIIDVRLRPYSRFRPIWNKGILTEHLGDIYKHIPAFGNLNYRGDMGPSIILQNPEQGLRDVLPILETQSIILICVCAHPSTCHRSEVAQILAKETGCEIVHLTDAILYGLPYQPGLL